MTNRSTAREIVQKQKKLSAAQQLGHDSYHTGLRPTDNPYTGPSNTAWSRGYDAAKGPSIIN
jgi:hypothetical protein